MGLFRNKGTVELPIEYAESLSHTGRMCAQSKGEARNYPGSFDRPVVRDPDVFSRRVSSVIRRAFRQDPELRGMRDRARSLSYSVESQLTPPYRVGGTAAQDALELAGLTSQIDERLASKNLTIGLEGRSLRAALDISAFALRVLGNPYDGLLYPGLPQEHPENTREHWLGLQSHLYSTERQPVAT